MLTITPANVNFKLIDGNAIYKGSDWYVEISIVNRENNVDTPINLAGFSGVCQIKRTTSDSEEPIISPKIDIIDPEGGTFSISLQENETALIPTTGSSYNQVERYQYEVKLTDLSGEVQRVMHGYVEVSPTAIKE